MKIYESTLNFKGQVVTNKKEVAKNILLSKPYANDIITAFNFINEDIKYNTKGGRDFSLSYTAKKTDKLQGEFKIVDLDTHKDYTSTFDLPLKPTDNLGFSNNIITKAALALIFKVLGDKANNQENRTNPELQRIIDRLI